MFSVIAGLAVAALAFIVALCKGRTGWHWFVLALFAFASAWLMSAVGLYFAGVHETLAAADRYIGGFDGALTGITIVAVLIVVPNRPKRHAAPFGALPRRPTS